MKKFCVFVFITLIQLNISWAQNSEPVAKKPSIMVVPSDVWCFQNNYMNYPIGDGEFVKAPNYKKALQENFELTAVISKIGELFANRGFPLVDLQASIQKMENDQAYINMLTSKKTGSELAESPTDILNRVAKADIIIKIGWQLNNTGRGPEKSVSFNMQGIDAYTSKQVTAASGTGDPSSFTELPVMLEAAVLSYIDKFCDGLQNHFDDIRQNGREGTLIVRVWEDSPVDLETEFQFKGRTAELKRIIGSYWMPRNTVNGSFSQDEASENVQRFTQVRIPLYGDDGWGGEIAFDFSTWAQQLSDLLKNDLKIENKIVPRGLGEVNIIIGGK